MNRRTVLQGLMLGGVASLTATDNSWALMSSPGATPIRRLIVVFLRGAVDGINLVVPYQEQNYYRLRPTIAIGKPGSADGAVALDGRFGLHPALAPLMPFWKGGSLAFVHAAGSPDPTRSHLTGRTTSNRGHPETRRLPTAG